MSEPGKNQVKEEVSVLKRCAKPRVCAFGRFTAVNGEHSAIAAELEKAHANFREFERKDIKYRWVRGRCTALELCDAPRQPLPCGGILPCPLLCLAEAR